MLNRYRLLNLLFLLSFLTAAFASKVYRGAGQRFAEAYLGDLFIVGCLYFGLGMIFLKMAVWGKAGIIAFISLLVESFQATGIPASWELPAPFTFIMGTAFDARDFLFYVLGIFIAIGIDIFLSKKRNSSCRHSMILC